MLDYEIMYFTVAYKCITGDKYSKKFYNEEEAVQFIKEHRRNWVEYSLRQLRYAIIDF